MGIKLNRPISEDDERSTMGFDIPNGKYLCKVNLCEEREKRDGGGDRYVHTELEILDAENRRGEESIGFKIFEQLSFSDAAEWRMVGFLDACYPPRFHGEEIPDDIEGKWLIVETRVEEYQGFSRPRCRSFKPPANWRGVDMKLDADGKEIAPVDKEEKKSENKKSEASASKDAKGSNEEVKL